MIKILLRYIKKSGFNPVKEYYRCPVKNCNSQFRGDEISRHFTKNANLDLLREALENQSNLRKDLPSGKVVANSDEFLKNLLAQVSNSEKVHTEYLPYARHYKPRLVYPISKDHLCTVTFGLMYGLYSRASSNQERPMMARVR